jgi:transmembrane sensor
MKNSQVVDDTPVPAERIAEASIWVTRLHGGNRDRAMEAGLRQWIAADPMNARALELATDVWEESENLRRVVPFAHDTEDVAPRRFRFGLSTVAATALIAAIATLAVILGVLHFQRENVVTKLGEQRLLALEDGSRVFLNTATTVEVHYDATTRRVVLESGEALFDVAKRADRPFVVEAGSRRVTALGTSFVVRRDEQTTAVTLVEGSVSVKAADGADAAAAAENAVTLSAGQRVTYSSAGSARIDQPSVERVVAWRRGQVILEDTPLAEAIAEMNRYSAVRLRLEQPDAAKLVINGLFQAGDSLSFANAVALSYGLTVHESGNEIVLEGDANARSASP